MNEIKDVNETIFRNALGLRNQPQYIDDLDAGAPISSVARDYATVELHKCFEALVCGHKIWKMADGKNEAWAEVTVAEAKQVAGELAEIAESIASYLGGHKLYYNLDIVFGDDFGDAEVESGEDGR
jgi:hypothetical protein